MGESSVSSPELCSPQCCLGAFKNWLLTTLDAVCKMHIWFLVCLSLEKLGSCELFYCLVCNCEFYEPTSRLFIVFHCSSLTAVLLFCHFLLAFLNQDVLKPGQQRWISLAPWADKPGWLWCCSPALYKDTNHFYIIFQSKCSRSPRERPVK